MAKVGLQEAIQPSLFAGPSTTICMICHQPGATVMHDMELERKNLVNGNMVPVKAYGWIHEECKSAPLE